MQVGSDRNASIPGSYWSSPEFARLNNTLQGQVTDAAPLGSPLRYKAILASLGFDYVQLYDSKTRSTGVVCMK